MAQRRMFSKVITSSSDFLMMSQSAQNLYFHIGMNSDDDGFCEIFSIMRMTESKPDDLRALHERALIYVIDNKVCIVKDWHENNYIQSDRYTQSKYLKDPKFIELYRVVMEEKISTIERYKSICIHDVSKMDTQVRLGKVRLGKVKREGNTPPLKGEDEIATRALGFLAWWNTQFGSKFKNPRVITKNLEYWLTIYSPIEICAAAINMKKDKYWKNIIDPVKLLRKKNPRGEDCDHIAEFMRVAPVESPLDAMVW